MQDSGENNNNRRRTRQRSISDPGPGPASDVPRPVPTLIRSDSQSIHSVLIAPSPSFSLRSWTSNSFSTSIWSWIEDSWVDDSNWSRSPSQRSLSESLRSLPTGQPQALRPPQHTYGRPRPQGMPFFAAPIVNRNPGWPWQRNDMLNQALAGPDFSMTTQRRPSPPFPPVPHPRATGQISPRRSRWPWHRDNELNQALAAPDFSMTTQRPPSPSPPPRPLPVPRATGEISPFSRLDKLEKLLAPRWQRPPCGCRKRVMVYTYAWCKSEPKHVFQRVAYDKCENRRDRRGWRRFFSRRRRRHGRHGRGSVDRRFEGCTGQYRTVLRAGSVRLWPCPKCDPEGFKKRPLLLARGTNWWLGPNRLLRVGGIERFDTFWEDEPGGPPPRYRRNTRD